MRRKHNPLLSLAALLLLAVILALTCIGCETAEATEAAASPKRFIVEEHEYIAATFGARVITDTETGVQYLLVSYGQGLGLTKLEEAPEE